MDTLARYCKFVRGLLANPSMEVVVMCGLERQDIRTVIGSNLSLVRVETGLDPLTASSMRKIKDKLQQQVTWAQTLTCGG